MWHASDGLERLLGYSEAELLGRSVDLFRARGEAPPAILDQVGELDAAIRHRHNKLIETVLSSASGAPVFCLVYVLPLHHHAGPRVGSVAVAILDVHSSLPMLQRHVDRGWSGHLGDLTRHGAGPGEPLTARRGRGYERHAGYRFTRISPTPASASMNMEPCE